MQDQALALNSSLRMETVLCRFRLLMVALALGMTLLFEPAFRGGALILALGLLGLNAHVMSASRRIGTLHDARRLGHIVLAADSAAAMVLFFLFLGDPEAMPVAFMPFLIFGLSIRFGTRGMAAGLVLFAITLGVRVFFQLFLLEGGAIRPPMLLLWCSLALLMVALSREFRAEEDARLAAMRERGRIASGFRDTISGVLARSGVAVDEASHQDVMDAVGRICEERSETVQELAARVADLLAAGTVHASGLTRREREILALMARGVSCGRIAAALFVSPSTVRNHIHNIKSKLEAGSREEIIEMARKRGLAL